MGRPRKTHVSEGKANIVAQLIEEYNIKTPQAIQAALRSFYGFFDTSKTIGTQYQNILYTTVFKLV